MSELDILLGFEKKRPKKRNLTHTEKAWVWEHNKHICHICGERIKSMLDATYDHKKAFSKGGATNLKNIKLAHRHCNLIKGNKSLSETRKYLGIKNNNTRKRKKNVKRKEDSMFPDIKLPELRLPKIELPKF